MDWARKLGSSLGNVGNVGKHAVKMVDKITSLRGQQRGEKLQTTYKPSRLASHAADLPVMGVEWRRSRLSI